jgi:hypothetical protein
MENRCGLKILFMLLSEGMNNAGNGVTFKEMNTILLRVEAFVKAIEEIINTTVIGSIEQPACWKLPYNSKNEVTSITLDNNRTRSLMLNLDSLIDICLDSDIKKAKFKECVMHYNEMFVMIRKKDDFTDDEIEEYQRLADYFFDEWIQLYGTEGITNYIHMIGSGHVADFLYEHHNLYRHSQQGWEHLNSFLKVYFFRRTMRGGGTNGGSKIKPVARWLARRMIWMSGTKYETINEFNKHGPDMDDDENYMDYESVLIHENSNNLDYQMNI